MKYSKNKKHTSPPFTLFDIHVIHLIKQINSQNLNLEFMNFFMVTLQFQIHFTQFFLLESQFQYLVIHSTTSTQAYTDDETSQTDTLEAFMSNSETVHNKMNQDNPVKNDTPTTNQDNYSLHNVLCPTYTTHFLRDHHVTQIIGYVVSGV